MTNSDIGGSQDDDQDRRERQQEWANWAAHGYRKMYQPRSILRFGAFFYGALVIFLLLLFWFLFSRHTLPW